MENNENQIIELLKEQNYYLKSLYEIQLQHQKSERLKTILHSILNLIPFLITIIIVYFIYSTLMGYIQTLNNNINTLKSGFEAFSETIKKLIPDFSGIQNSLQNTWENLKNL